MCWEAVVSSLVGGMLSKAMSPKQQEATPPPVPAAPQAATQPDVNATRKKARSVAGGASDSTTLLTGPAYGDIGKSTLLGQ